MKKYLVVLLALFLFSCSSDEAFSGRRITFKVNGVTKVYEDIKVQAFDSEFDGVPFTRLQITAKPKDGSLESFSVVINRGGSLNGQSLNGSAFVNENPYNYDFDHPLATHITTNTTKKIKGTFEGIYNGIDGQNLEMTEGTIDITYYPPNPNYIKQ